MDFSKQHLAHYFDMILFTCLYWFMGIINYLELNMFHFSIQLKKVFRLVSGFEIKVDLR